MHETDVIQRFPSEPITESRIAADLSRVGLRAGDTVLVHSSLSALGWVCGGAAAVVSALQSVVRPFGNLIMPTHSGDLSDPAGWSNPSVPESWWDVIRETLPPFDPETTPSYRMGVIPEYFRLLPDVVRSLHPHTSFAAWGERSVDIVSAHGLEYGLGDESPLAKIYELNGRVLLLGVGFERNTSFHLAEYRAHFPKREIVEQFAPLVVDGHRRWKRFEDINIDATDFGELGRDFLRSSHSRVTEGRIANASCYLFPQSDAVDYAVRWIEKHRR